MKIPYQAKQVPGTYPATKIQEGYSKANSKNWDATFGIRTCGACKRWPGAGLPCKARKPERLMEHSGQDACFSAFERAALPSCAGEEMMPVEEE